MATGSVGTTIKLHSYRVHHSKLKLCSFFVKFVSVWCKHISRGGDTSMAGMAIAIPGVLNISKTGDTMGKIR